MPLVDFHQQATWDSLYTSGATGLHYDRRAKQDYIGDDAKKLIAALASKGMVKGQRIILVGAGFGWVAEEFIAEGFGPPASTLSGGLLCATDTSLFIAGGATTQAIVPIVNADVLLSTGRSTIKSVLGLHGQSVADWCITEDMLPGFSDADCRSISAACRLIATNVAHWHMMLSVPGAQDQRLNWKSISDWKALATPDIIVSRQTGAVL